MSETRLTKLEEQMQELQKIFIKVEVSLLNIEKTLASAVSVKDTVTTHIEKLKVTENRLKDLEIKDEKKSEQITWINVKIAVYSGVWMAVLFIIQVRISKYLK